MIGPQVGFLATTALRAHVNGKRKSPVADTIDEWNRVCPPTSSISPYPQAPLQRFFHPRCMDVVLAQGGFTYTGPADAPPPDMRAAAPASASSAHVQAYDDESDDDTLLPVGMSRFGAQGRRRERRPRKRTGRIQFTRDLRASAKEKWRLVVSYKPPVL